MFQRAQHDPFYAEALLSIRSHIQTDMRDTISEFLLKNVERITELVALAKEISAAHPGIENRHLFWGRHWDMVEYLLSTARRENRDPASRVEEIIHKAIYGSIQIPNAQSYIHFVWANDVADAANYLANISIESLRPIVNVIDMQEKAVYKSIQLPTDNDEVFEILKEDIVAFRDFYVLVAEHNEGIVTFLG
jgi:hypothetical protein